MPLASANVQENKSQPAQKPVPQQKDTPTAKQMIKQNTKQGAANATALNGGRPGLMRTRRGCVTENAQRVLEEDDRLPV